MDLDTARQDKSKLKYSIGTGTVKIKKSAYNKIVIIFFVLNCQMEPDTSIPDRSILFIPFCQATDLVVIEFRERKGG